MEKMVKKIYECRLLTPAFLGNAEQESQWRTPPFKHLLREWWRVAWAARNNPADWKAMREVEGRLFGHAWLDSDRDEQGRKVSGRKSRVLLRLDAWEDGQLRSLPVTMPVAKGSPVSACYLGYGAVEKKTELRHRSALRNCAQARLSVAFPEGVEGVELIEEAFALAHAFGTLGRRSRNGWGSLHIQPRDGQSPAIEIKDYVRDWQECLQQAWAYAIGRDKDCLVWHTREPREKFPQVMDDLGKLRYGINRLHRNKKIDGKRRVLNQPVAGKGSRLPSNLRFKVVENDNGTLQGQVIHMPCTPPVDTKVDEDTVKNTWEAVHNYLDNNSSRLRCGV